MALQIQRIDSRQADVRAALAALRERLSPRGNVVSEAGRRRTIEVFGEPLSPGRSSSGSAATCSRVASPPCSTIRPGSIRPSLRPRRCACRPPSWPTAHRQADPELLAAVRSIRDRILEFQRAILHRDVRSSGPTAAG